MTAVAGISQLGGSPYDYLTSNTQRLFLYNGQQANFEEITTVPPDAEAWQVPAWNRMHACPACPLGRPAWRLERLPVDDGDKFDLYPSADRAAPCLVFIHGGYWQRNSRDLFAMMVEGMFAHGWSVAIMGYTLAPEATVTQIARETTLALDWLAADGPSYGIAGQIVLSGWSAGAQMTALRCRFWPRARPRPGGSCSRIQTSRSATNGALIF